MIEAKTLRNTSLMMLPRDVNREEFVQSIAHLPKSYPPRWFPCRRTHLTIMGGHGSGKSTLALALWDTITGSLMIDDCGIELANDPKARAHTNNILLMLGKYGVTRKCGGMDSIPTDNDRLYVALEAAFKRHEILTIGEGALINSMKMMDWFAEQSVRYNRHIVVIHLVPQEDIQFTRIEARSGRKRSDLVGDGKHVIRKNRQFQKMDLWTRENHPQFDVISISCRWYISVLLEEILQQLEQLDILRRM